MDTNETPGSTLSFLGVINIAMRLATQAHPQAKLYEVDCHPQTPGSVNVIKDLKVIFRLPNNQTGVLTMTNWGEFSPMQVIASPYVGDIVIPWPVKMEIVKADQLLKAAGYTQPYGAVTLRWPLYPGNTEPYYIFSFGGGTYGFVGTDDGKVKEYKNPA